jgi:ectoine hydroxylase-related dioxygenase (phytanoyl-CoA dioxygenase family)
MCYHHSWFWEFACRPAVVDVMSELYGGGDVQIFSDTVFMKPPRHGIEAAPHQDTAFWPKLSPNAILFWMAIDPATIENGCLHIVPQSHRNDLSHHTDPVQGKMLADAQFDTSKQTPIELAPGSALIMDSGLIHRSYPNRSDRSRRAMTSVYVSADVRHVAPWTQKYKFKPIRSAAATAI